MMSLSLSRLWSEAARGKSIARILANEVFQQWEHDVQGTVLDLACGRAPSYRRILGLTGELNLQLVGVDLSLEKQPSVVADLNAPLPFEDRSADTVIVSSFLYISAEPGGILREILRVLKHGGALLLSVPLVYPHNPEPTDYWRFTEEALRLIVDQAGFAEFLVVPFGGRWTAAAYLLSPFLRPVWLIAPVVYWLCLKMDVWTGKRFSSTQCPIGYVAKARKPA